MDAEANPPPADGDPVAGSVVGERYRLIEKIGEGGMGTVFRAEHMLMKKIVAVKLLHREVGRIDEFARRFEREAQSASRLSHENIIQVTDFGRTPSGALFLVMEFLRGESLADHLHRSGAFGVPRAVGIARQILRALAHAHGQGVVHRDLKPANIMLAIPSQPDTAPVDFVKLLDFGIAKMSDETPTAGERRLTQAGVIFGTPDYMSPEQAIGEETDHRADLYSFGAILFEMLTGRQPFVADSAVALLSMHLTRPPPTLREVAPAANLPEALERIVHRALTKERDRRFQTATEFLEALDTLGGERYPGRALSLWQRLPAPVQRLGSRVAIAATAILIAAGIVYRLARPATPTPKPVEAEVVMPVRLAEEALGRGEVLKARAILTQQLSEHPTAARVHYLLGNLDFIEHLPEDGMRAYQDAIRFDGGYRGDAALIRNVRALLDDKKLAAPALDLLINDIGRPAGPVLAPIASGEHRAELRHAALAACERLGCSREVDRLQSYLLDLHQGKRCAERRDAVLKLRELGDPRALDALRKQRQRGGGPLDGLFGSPNDCMKKDLDETISQLERR